ncbi:hypothetical protein LJC04_05445 [Ruminococcaceae bacterium OttesenSCG-928-O06]|nr:hypothetical protein [Ruminococcaceae bacterium OttesenSCG-928-O06]
MFMNDVLIFKKQLMWDICTNEDIIALIDVGFKAKNHDPDISDIEYYPYRQVFPYLYAPDVEDEEKVYLCYDFETLGLSPYNDIQKDLEMTIYIVSHRKKMRVETPAFQGARTDLLMHEFDSLLSRNPDYGFSCKISSTTVMPNPPKDHYGFIMRYDVKSINSDNTHAKANYVNRIRY